jgi:DNA-binding HxlR family transcriptional regulator
MTRSLIAQTDSVAINAVLVVSRQAADVVNDRWSLTLVLAMLQGEKRFKGLLERTGMANRLLTARLRTLEDAGLILRMPYQMHPVRHEYHLTKMGADVSDVILQMARWEQRWAPGETGANDIVHLSCGAALRPQLRCTACGELTTARDIELRVSRAQIQKVPDKQTVHRRSTISSESLGAPPQMLGPSLDIFGDKWTIEVLLCAFFRIRRFNDFRLCIGIAPNILADRLDRLVSGGILRRVEESSSQSGYRLTEKGVDVYGVMVAVEKWADTWLRARYKSPVKAIHRQCGHVFRSLTTCTHCEQAVTPAEIGFAMETLPLV